jgi:hypothetical protein
MYWNQSNVRHISVGRITAAGLAFEADRPFVAGDHFGENRRNGRAGQRCSRAAERILRVTGPQGGPQRLLIAERERCCASWFDPQRVSAPTPGAYRGCYVRSPSRFWDRALRTEALSDPPARRPCGEEQCGRLRGRWAKCFMANTPIADVLIVFTRGGTGARPTGGVSRFLPRHTRSDRRSQRHEFMS